MSNPKVLARIIGALYITGTVSGILSLAFTASIQETDNILLEVASNPNQLVLGALCVLLMGLALAMVPVMAFPILKKHNEALALGYVVFRGALESVIYMAMVVSWFLLLPLSHALEQSGNADLANFQALSRVLLSAEELASILTIVFCLGALLFYTVLYQSKLVPRWLSGWGLLAIVPYLLAGILPLFGLLETLSTPYVLMNIPLAIQEMVLALWLIIRGFNPEALEAKRSFTGNV